MGTDNNMREGLLKQMNADSGGKAQIDKKSIEKILARDAARVWRMKWITVCTWVLVAVLFIVGGVFERNPSYKSMMWLNTLIMILRALVLVAVIFTVSFYARSRSLQMKQIQQRLSEIEKLLRKLDKA